MMRAEWFGRSLVPLCLVLAFAGAGCQPAQLDDPSGEADDSAAQADALNPLQDLIYGLFGGGFTATSGATFYPTADAAIAQIASEVKNAGFDSPNDLVYLAQVRTLPLSIAGWNHSEFAIPVALGLTGGGGFVLLQKRLVGDSAGAGMFTGTYAFYRPGPRLCLSWAQLQTAIRASYVKGKYALNYVCHNVTAAVLTALGISPGYYEALIPSWKMARLAFGDAFSASGGLSEDPRDWSAYRQCDILEDFLASSPAAGY